MKKLLPGEVNEFYVRNGVRADGRPLRQHRQFLITREVLGSGNSVVAQKVDGGAPKTSVVKVSNSVKLGHTHVICSLEVSEQQRGSCLSIAKPAVNIQLTLLKDSSLNLRRDLVEEKENAVKHSLR